MPRIHLEKEKGPLDQPGWIRLDIFPDEPTEIIVHLLLSPFEQGRLYQILQNRVGGMGVDICNWDSAE